MTYFNTEFLIAAYFISMFVDWVFQWKWQANNKSKWVKGNLKNAFFALVSHCLIYSVLTTGLLGWLFNYSLNYLLLIHNTLFISHILIDNRFIVKIILRFKGLSNKDINDYANYGFMHIGIDHRLHESVLLALSFFV